MQITTIGLDIAKHVFQVHGIDAEEKVVVRKKCRRGQVMQFFAKLLPCALLGWWPAPHRITGPENCRSSVTKYD
jgi:transposase